MPAGQRPSGANCMAVGVDRPPTTLTSWNPLGRPVAASPQSAGQQAAKSSPAQKTLIGRTSHDETESRVVASPRVVAANWWWWSGRGPRGSCIPRRGRAELRRQRERDHKNRKRRAEPSLCLSCHSRSLPRRTVAARAWSQSVLAACHGSARSIPTTHLRMWRNFERGWIVA